MSDKLGHTVEVSNELYERLVRYRAELEIKTGRRITIREALDIYCDMVVA